jgi:hypothetical protein
MAGSTAQTSISLIAAATSVAVAVGLNVAISSRSAWLIAVCATVFVLGSVALSHLLLTSRPLPSAAETATIRRLRHSLAEYSSPSQDNFQLPLEIRTQNHDGGVTVRQTDSGSMIAEYGRGKMGNLLLRGSDGSGKSVLAARMALHLCDLRLEGSGRRVPIFLQARFWTGDESLERWLARQVTDHHSVSRRLLTEWINSGELLVVLDGLDEAGPSSASLLSEIRRWSDQRSGNQVIATVRSNMLDRALSSTSTPFPTTGVIKPLERGAVNDLIARIVPTGKGLDRRRNEGVMDLDLWRRPELASLLAASFNPDAGAAQDEAATSIAIGDDDLRERDVAAAKRAYTRAIESSSGPFSRAVALTKLALLLESEGKMDAARESLNKAIEVRSQVVTRWNQPLSPTLTPQDKIVFEALSTNVAFSLPQIAARAGLPLARVRESLGSLKTRGFVQSVGLAENQRFKASLSLSVNL